MEERNVDTWEQLIEQVDEVRRKCDEGNSALLFRGQENSCWLLDTTLDRTRSQMFFRDYYRVIYRIKPEIESSTRRQWVIPEPGEIDLLVQDYDKFSLELWAGSRLWYSYLAYLRHHGFPSPLLDWTQSLYVAAYFAFRKAPEIASGRVSIFLYSSLNGRTRGNEMRVVYRLGHYVDTHKRHKLQESQYTMCIHWSAEKAWFETHEGVFVGQHSQGFCLKFNVPGAERAKVLTILEDDHKINAFSLFGSEDTLMEALALREFCASGFDAKPVTSENIVNLRI